MINKMENDQAQKSAVRNTSDFAKKVYAAFNDCVAREVCPGPGNPRFGMDFLAEW